MNSSQKADYINNMPYEMFVELLSDKKSAVKAYNVNNKLMIAVNQQRPSDNRGFARKTLNKDILMSCVQGKYSLLTAKMVSLNIIFANPVDEPNYFKEICDVFSKENEKDGGKTIDYSRIASIYGTTVDNVKSNILFTEYKDKMNELSQQKRK